MSEDDDYDTVESQVCTRTVGGGEESLRVGAGWSSREVFDCVDFAYQRTDV